MKIKNRLKIALVWPLITSGESTEFYNVQAFGLAKALVNMGCNVTILTADREMRFTKPFSKNRDGFRIIYLPVIKDSLRHPVMPSLITQLKKLKPDCIQCAEILSPSTYMAFAFARISKTSFFIYQGTYKWPRKLTRFMPLINPLFIRPVLKNCSAVFTKSDQARTFLIKSGAKGEKVHTVHLGFENKPFYQANNSSYLNRLCGIKEERTILLCVGRLVPVKNHLNIIKAVERLTLAKPDIYLVILGTGPLLTELNQYIAEKKLEGHVKIVTKKIKQSDMSLVYSSAKVFLSPSTYEIFGMTVIEAMACGLPVIGSPVGGMKDIIHRRKNGLLVAPDKPSEIALAINSLLNDKSLYETLINNGLETCKRFLWADLSEKMIVFYDQKAKNLSANNE